MILTRQGRSSVALKYVLEIIADTRSLYSEREYKHTHTHTHTHTHCEFTATETTAGGTLLYIINRLSYKCRNDLNIYNKHVLESTFIETVNPKKSNIIVGSYLLASVHGSN